MSLEKRKLVCYFIDLEGEGVLDKGDIVENMKRGKDPVVQWKNVGWWKLLNPEEYGMVDIAESRRIWNGGYC